MKMDNLTLYFGPSLSSVGKDIPERFKTSIALCRRVFAMNTHGMTQGHREQKY
jgi:hypothetical protein